MGAFLWVIHQMRALIALLVAASGIWCVQEYNFRTFGGLKGSASLSSFCSSSLLNTRNLAFFLVF